ncbi:MAG: AraC-like DNA-binding protein [Kangiellaceae bacterium]|jgi:AraC-like DNA-binding protein
MDAVVVKGCTMRFTFALAPMIGTVENVFTAQQLAQVSAAMSQDSLVHHVSFFLFDISIVLISFTTFLGIILGVFGNMIFTKFSQRFTFLNVYFASIYSKLRLCAQQNNLNRQTPQATTRISESFTPSSNANNNDETVHCHIRKSWVCHPLEIIVKQLSGLESQPVKIDFTNHISNAIEPIIKVCPIWFSNAVQELLSNALTHNSGNINLTVAMNTYIDNKTFTVTIVDNGVGISEKITHKLDSTAGPSSQIVATIYSPLIGPTNLFSIGSLLRQMRGTLQVSSARKFLTKITMNLPLLDNIVPCSIDIKSNEVAKINDFKLLNMPLVKVNGIQNEKQELAVYKQGRPMIVKDCIADYQVSLGEADNVNDQKSIKFVDKFSRLLLEHYAKEGFNRPFAAKMMLMTEKTLTRRLNMHYQLGFVEALRKFRLHQAKDLLLYGEKVTNVAFDTGFSSPSYFAQCFKVEFGFAPSFLVKRLAALKH